MAKLVFYLNADDNGVTKYYQNTDSWRDIFFQLGIIVIIENFIWVKSNLLSLNITHAYSVNNPLYPCNGNTHVRQER